jgi:hypothetical protein
MKDGRRRPPDPRYLRVKLTPHHRMTIRYRVDPRQLQSSVRDQRDNRCRILHVDQVQPTVRIACQRLGRPYLLETRQPIRTVDPC